MVGTLSPVSAAIEAVSANLCWGIDRFRVGVPIHEARLVGGGSTNPLWNQILADMLDATVIPMQEPESGALGAAIQAAWSMGGDAARRLGRGGGATDAVRRSGFSVRKCGGVSYFPRPIQRGTGKALRGHG